MNQNELTTPLAAENYVAYLATQVGVFPEESIVKQLADGKKTKTEVNQAFFAWLEARQTVEVTAPQSIESVLTEDTLKRLSSIVLESKDDRLKELQKKIDEHHKEADNFARYAQNQLSEMTKYSNEYMAIQSSPSFEVNFLDEAKKIVASGFYSILGVSGDLVNFITKPVVLSYFKSSAGINITVPMGTYKVSLNYKTFAIHVTRGSENIAFNNHIHPHVSSGGEICFGNVKSEQQTCVKKRNVVRLMELASLVLKDYSNEAPFVNLERFYQEYFKLSGKVGTGVIRYERSGSREVLKIKALQTSIDETTISDKSSTTVTVQRFIGIDDTYGGTTLDGYYYRAANNTYIKIESSMR